MARSAVGVFMVERCLNWTAEACSDIGLGLLAAAIPAPRRRGSPGGAYLFEDDFDGPGGSPPIRELDGAELAGRRRGRRSRAKYRDDRQVNVFLDGNSNLVIQAARGRRHVLQRQGARELAGADGATPGRRASSSTAWYRGPAHVLGRQRDPLPDGEVDIMVLRQPNWPRGRRFTPHRTERREGKSIAGLVDGAWHNWRMRWDENRFKFWRD